jgi:hypothetical protein
MDRRIIAGFDKPSNAVDAVKELISKDLSPEDISLLSNGEVNQQFTILDPQGHNIAKANIMSGTSLDGADLNPEGVIETNKGESILAAGPLSGLLAMDPEDGVGGALINYGANYEESRHFAESISQGKTLLVTRTSEEKMVEVTNILSNHGAQEITSYIETGDGIN